MAKVIKLSAIKKGDKKKLGPFQKLLLTGPVMTDKQYQEYLKTNKWIAKWKV